MQLQSQSEVRPGSALAWFLAARPKTLTAAMIPVLMPTERCVANRLGCVCCLPL